MGHLRWYFDTSVLVSAAAKQHPHHSSASIVLEDLIKRKHRGFISAHGLMEFYAVLTRTPFKPPFYPSESWQIIERIILPHMELVVLTPEEYTGVVRDCATSGWIGGRIYDAIQLKCAQKANCDRIYTFNVKDFRTLAPKGLEDKISAP